MSDLKEVRLYGHLGREFGRSHRFAISNPMEAMKALAANYKGFEQAFTDHKPGYRIYVGYETVGENQVQNPCGREVIRIVPVVTGAGGEIVLADIIWYAVMTVVNNWELIALYVASQMLAPSPPKVGTNDRPDNKPSYAFDGAVNTAAQGNPVAVGYGHLMIGSQVISAGLTVDQL